MYFPRLSGMWMTTLEGRRDRKGRHRVLHSLACAGCDVEQQQHAE